MNTNMFAVLFNIKFHFIVSCSGQSIGLCIKLKQQTQKAKSKQKHLLSVFNNSLANHGQVFRLIRRYETVQYKALCKPSLSWVRARQILKFTVEILQFKQQKQEDNRTMSQSELSNGQEPQVAGFVGKTFEILNNQEYSKIIFWGHSGRDFVIKDINKFQQIVLPKYFRHRKINSFIRQLNMYGFHKSRKDNSKSIFSHPNFLKDREDLLPTIKRKIKCFDTPQTPKKPKIQLPSKQMLETAAKEAESLKKIPQFPSHNLLKGIFESRQYLGSRFNLNVSLIKLSMNQLDHCQKKSEPIQDDKLSIEFDIENRHEDFADGGNIVNPSFFFNSFKEYAIK